ncbi:MAG: LPS export ABC transporter permease LptG [Alphaproteobacteria bacterium]|nr:MAG: LPS export ABC transporter permease LptG [Alphaproteobacteria bacterium]
MRLSLTLTRYLGRQFLTGILIVLFAVLMLVFVIDFVETLRKFGGREGVEFGLMLSMSLSKLPGLAEKLVPFTVLFGGMWTFTRLTRSHELVVARAAGVSVWQFLAPALGIGLFLGIFMVAAFNPFAASMNARYERLEARYVDGQESQLSVSSSGLWLRQGDRNNQSVVHAVEVHDQGLRLEQVVLLFYKGGDEFQYRIDAKEAQLSAMSWQLKDAWISDLDTEAQFHAEYSVPTTLTIDDIEDSFASPNTMSVWELPRFIRMAETAGFSATRHRIHWHSILSEPLLLCAMILIAATFSLRMARLGGIGRLIFAGIMTGFGLYFFTDLTEALGLSGSLPVALAAWAPTGIAALGGTTMLFHLEDG